MSCYVEAANRDQYMAIKESLFLMILDIFHKNGIQLANSTRLLELSGAGALPGEDALAGQGRGWKHGNGTRDALRCCEFVSLMLLLLLLSAQG